MSEQKLLKDPFDVLSKLAEIGKEVEEVIINDNFKITLSTIGAEDEAEIFAAAQKTTGTTEYFSITKRETLARAIIAVNGLSLKEYEKLQDAKTYDTIKAETLTKLRKIISEWNENLVSFAYNKWSVLIKRSEDKLVAMKILEPIPEKTEEKKENK